MRCIYDFTEYGKCAHGGGGCYCVLIFLCSSGTVDLTKLIQLIVLGMIMHEKLFIIIKTCPFCHHQQETAR